MTYVVSEQCIRCKFMDCVSVCPVDCFREGDTMLVIDPETCIDCGICEPECPASAIRPGNTPEGARWLDLNARLALVWPSIVAKGVPPADADSWLAVENKFAHVFSDAPPREDAR